MTLFSIVCSTCQTKLNVRDAALIGQILACPKCKSMVLVEAPPEYDPAHQEPAGKTEQDANEQADEQAAEPNAGAEDGERRRPSPNPHYDSQADTKPMSIPAPEEMDQEAVLPNAKWSSSESQQLKRILLFGGIGVGAVIVTVAMCGFWIARSRQAAAAIDTPGETDPVKSTDASANVGGQDPKSPTALGGQPNERNAPISPPDDNSQNTEPLGPGEGAQTAIVDPPAPVNSEDPPKPAPPEPPPGDVAETTQTPQAPPGFNSDKPESDDSAALTESLRKLEDLLSDGEDDLDEDLDRSPQANLKSPVVLAEKPQMRNVDVGVQLKRPIVQLQYEGPLVDFTRFVSELSTIPITLDPGALRAVGMKSVSPVAVRKENASVEQVLTAALEPRGLAISRRQGHLRVELAPSAEPVTLDVTDLSADGPKQVQTLAKWISVFVAPTSWSSKGGAGRLTVQGRSLIVTNHPQVVFETKRFLDRLRLARSMEPQFGVTPSALRLEPVADPEKLSRPVTANFRIPTYFTDVLRHLSREAELEILVDWQAAAEAGWNHDGSVRLNVVDKPMKDALGELLGPMELAYLPIDNDTIQITTPAIALRHRDVCFHRADDVLQTLEGDVQSLMTLIAATLGERRFQDPGGMIIFIDPQSKQLIVYGTSKDQRDVANLLQKVRSK